nr:MAG TPA: hypothetical protein [Caudoviricetes sp.]
MQSQHMSGDWWYRGRRNHIHYMRSKTKRRRL